MFMESNLQYQINNFLFICKTKREQVNNLFLNKRNWGENKQFWIKRKKRRRGRREI